MEHLSELMNVDAARLASALNVATQLYNTVAYSEWFWGILLCMLALGIIYRKDILSWRQRLRESKRMNHEERAMLNALVADIITDGLEDAVHKLQITPEQRLKVYEDLSGRYPDLKRRSLPLKAAIEERLAQTKRDVEGKVVPLPLPKEEVPAKKLIKEKLQAAHVHVL